MYSQRLCHAREDNSPISVHAIGLASRLVMQSLKVNEKTCSTYSVVDPENTCFGVSKTINNSWDRGNHLGNRRKGWVCKRGIERGILPSTILSLAEPLLDVINNGWNVSLQINDWNPDGSSAEAPARVIRFEDVGNKTKKISRLMLPKLIDGRK